MTAGEAGQPYITLIENNEAKVSISVFIDKLEKCVASLLSGKLSMERAGAHQHLCPADIATIISEIDTPDQVQLAVRNILLNAVINSEKTAAGSGIIVALTFLESRKCVVHDNELGVMSSLTNITDMQSAKNILKTFFGIDDKLYYMILQTCELAGHNGRVYINDIPKDISYIELTSGYRFNCHISPEFRHASKITSWTRGHPRVFIIDGMIENVSEIHHLLESLSGSIEPGVIFARGYAEEVIATLAVNYKRNTLDVIPVVVPYDLQGMNMLKDIAVVCGCDVVSSLKGELISNIKFDEIQTAEYVLADADNIVIRHETTHQYVSAHIKDLKKRITEKDIVRDKVQLLNERIKALTSGCVEISLGPEYAKNIDMNVRRLETGIQMMAEISRTGIIDLKKAVNSIDANHIIAVVFKRLLTSNFLYIPAPTGVHGIQFGLDASTMTSSIGAYIIRDH